VPHERRPAAFFDLDKTVIAGSSALALARPFRDGGLLTRGAALRGLYAQLGYLSFGADHDRTERMKGRLAALSRGWDAEQTAEVVAGALERYIRPVVYAEALDLVAEHQRAGHDVVVVSASSETVVRPIAGLLGADHVIATRPVIAEGRYTGELDFYAYGPAKATAIAELAAACGYDLATSHAYSDSLTDLPMLEAVGHPVAVNPDRALRRHARAQGWPVRTFARPVAPRQARFPAVATLAAAAALSAVGGWAWGRSARERRDRPLPAR